MSRQKDIEVISMTGFGAAREERDGILLEIEARAVNSRYLDVVFRMPREYSQFESELRTEVGEHLTRGRVDLQVTRTQEEGASVDVQFNQQLFDAYYACCLKVAKEKGLESTGFQREIVRELLGKREIVEPVPSVINVEKERELLLSVARKALDSLGQMRVNEGKRIGVDLKTRIGVVATIRDQLAAGVGKVNKAIQKRLQEKVAELLKDLPADENRMLQEVAYLTDRSDITEEVVRAQSHLAQFQEVLTSSPNGRKLEFILQELGREFNTVAAKAQDAEVQRQVVEAKGELEKIREQVQNIE